MRWFSKIDEKDSWRMQVVSYFFFLIQKMLQFFKVESCQIHTCSIDSPYTENGNPHFHTEYRLNWWPHEYNNTWIPLATLSVHALKLPLNHDPFKNDTSPLWWRSSARLDVVNRLWYFYLMPSQGKDFERAMGSDDWLTLIYFLQLYQWSFTPQPMTLMNFGEQLHSRW